jgi:hypothetical protein
MAELERGVIFQRTKEALRVLKERGIRLGKPVGTIQHSIFDRYKDKIKEWYRLGFPYTCQARALKLSTTGLVHYIKSRQIFRGNPSAPTLALPGGQPARLGRGGGLGPLGSQAGGPKVTGPLIERRCYLKVNKLYQNAYLLDIFVQVCSRKSW